MHLNFKQHKLLGLLTNHYIKWNETKNGVVGVSFDEINEALNCTKEELHLISAKLFDEKEVGLYRVGLIEGLHIDNNGISAYANEKYKKEYWLNIRNRLKDYLNITVSTIAIITAIVTSVISITSLYNNRNKIEKLEQQVYKIEQEKTPSNVLTKTPDSLSLKDK